MLTRDSDTSSFGVFSVADAKALSVVQNQTYTLAAPGPVPDRQDAPHLHDAILDPTGKFLLSPDLGSDLIHVYKIEAGAAKVTELTSVKAVPGSGPRHGAFSVQGMNTYFYTVNELGNSITGYDVMYMGDSEPMFTELFSFSTHGPGATVPAGTKAAEMQVSVSSSSPPHSPCPSTVQRSNKSHSLTGTSSSSPRAARCRSRSRTSTRPTARPSRRTRW